MPAYPSKALQEYLLKSDLLTVGGTSGSVGAAGAPGATGTTGLPWKPAESLTAPSVASGGTIATANLTVSRVDPITAVSDVVLQVGTVAGQRIIVLNQSDFTIQFAPAAASHVSNGATSICPPLTCIRLLWDTVTGYWYPAPGAIGTAPVLVVGVYDVTGYDESTYGATAVGSVYGTAIYGSSPYGVSISTGTYGMSTYGVGTYGP